MIRKKNNSNSFNDRKKGRSNRQKNFRSDDRYGNDVKVVSTNVVKENKQVEVKVNNAKNNYQTVKKEEYNKSYNKSYSKPNNKKYQRNTHDPKRQSLIQKEIQSYQVHISQDKKICSKCNKRIDYISNSIYDKNKDMYYHFDCVLSEVKKDMLIKSNQRVVYLGSGAFGLVENNNNHNSSQFTIKKKIQYIQDQAVS